jgi:hypothetical protein
MMHTMRYLYQYCTYTCDFPPNDALHEVRTLAISYLYDALHKVRTPVISYLYDALHDVLLWFPTCMLHSMRYACDFLPVRCTLWGKPVISYLLYMYDAHHEVHLWFPSCIMHSMRYIHLWLPADKVHSMRYTCDCLPEWCTPWGTPVRWHPCRRPPAPATRAARFSCTPIDKHMDNAIFMHSVKIPAY